MKIHNKSRSGVVLRGCRDYFGSKLTATAMFCAALAFAAHVGAKTPLYAPPISRTDAEEIASVIRAVTKKPILMIVNIVEDNYVPGAVTGYAYEEDLVTGKRKPQYTRNDLVSVYMRYTHRSHVDVYLVRKVRGHWRVQSKKDWYL